MLVLSRRANESILIGDNVEIVVVGMENGRVRIGIKAPRDINVVRKELVKNGIPTPRSGRKSSNSEPQSN